MCDIKKCYTLRGDADLDLDLDTDLDTDLDLDLDLALHKRKRKEQNELVIFRSAWFKLSNRKGEDKGNAEEY